MKKLVLFSVNWLKFISFDCAFLLILTGCNVIELFEPKPTPAPHPQWLAKFLQNPTCAPPCWEGITPGVTSIWDVVPILSQVPKITNIEGPEEILRPGYQVSWGITLM